jgi:hypothetical protein
LRYERAKGARGRLILMARPTTSDGQPSTRQPWSVQEDVVVEAVDQAGMHQTVTVMSPMVEGAQTAPFAQALATLAGTVMHVTLEPRGAMSDVKIDVPAGDESPEREAILEGVSSSLSAQTVRLPQEAVGRGASWTSTADLTILGLRSTRVVKFTLVSRQGSRVSLHLISDTTAAPGQTVTVRGRPITFEKYVLHTEADAVIDLTGFDATFDGHTVTSLAFSSGQVRMVKETAQDVTIKPVT